METRRVWLAGLATSLLCIGAARSELPPDGEKVRALVEEALRRSEAAGQRLFDPAFRAAAARALAALSTEELEARASRGGIAPLALGDSSEKLVYTPVPPCRLIDTRQAGGTLAAGTVRDFKVTGAGLQIQGGNPNGCGVPTGPATAAVINFVAVNPVGPGNLRAWAYSTPPVAAPSASILNYAAVSGLNIANGIVVPICDSTLTTCPALDLRVQADVNGTHLVADVVGYFERFPKEVVRSFSVFAASSTPVPIASTCTHVTGLEATIMVPVAGKVIVRSNLQTRIVHTQGVDDLLRAFVGEGPSDCTSHFSYHALSAGVPSGAHHNVTPVVVSFNVAPGTYTYYANILAIGNVGDDVVNHAGETSTLELSFIPN